MKYLFAILLTLIGVKTRVFSQIAAPSIQWQKTLGGANHDRAHCIQQTIDGGYIIAGEITSNDGDVTGFHGDYDCWIVKLDVNGNIKWQKALGGTGQEVAYSIQQTKDGGFIVAGWTTSNDGDVTGNHGGGDYWVVKLDANGNIVWQKTLGGTNGECANSVQQTTDGGYIVSGLAGSRDGDVTGVHGIYADYWIVKLDANGNILWQKALGGYDVDVPYSIKQTTDGGYIVAGYTTSKDGDVTGFHGGSADSWIVKLDANGNKLWQKTLGGTCTQTANSIKQTTDGGYIVAGYTCSNDGDVTGLHAGSIDCWVIKLDTKGNILWQKTLGGSGHEFGQSIQQSKDGGFIIAGDGGSNDGDMAGSIGGIWIVKLDANGNKLWHRRLGGTAGELINTGGMQQTTDGGYVVAGTTSSNDGDVTANHGNPPKYDFWIVKLNRPLNDTCTAVVPAISIAVNAGTTICEGTKVTFTATATNGGTTPVYQWKKNGINVGANRNTYVDTALKNGDSIYCEFTSNDACAIRSAANSNGIKMAVSNPSTPTVSITAKPGASVCVGTKVTFTATITNGGTAPVYQWKKNGVNVGTNSKIYVVDTALKSGDSIYCVTTSNATCTNKSKAKSNGIKITVNSAAIPTVSIAASSGSNFCAGMTVTFTATGSNGGKSPIYQWRKNGMNVGTNSKTYVDTLIKNGDSVYCLMASNASCVSMNIVNSNGIKMTANNSVKPTISITASPGKIVCTGTKVTFTATATNGGSAPIYQWKKNGINVGINSNTYVVDTALKNSDSIYCVLTSSANCVNKRVVNSNEIKMVVNTCLLTDNSFQHSTLLKGEIKKFTVSATPNPFRNSVQLTVISPVSVKAVVLITNITGQKVFKQDILLNPGTNIIPVTATTWTAGTYYVQVDTDSERKSYKIIKQ